VTFAASISDGIREDDARGDAVAHLESVSMASMGFGGLGGNGVLAGTMLVFTLSSMPILRVIK
jgi:hypothetical protein